MAIDKDHPLYRPLNVHHVTLLAVVAVAAFHFAYWKQSAAASVLYLGCVWLLALRWEGSLKEIFVGGMALGLALYVPPLQFFFNQFGLNGAAVWMYLALWPTAFLLLSRVAVRRLGAGWTAFALPFVWITLEYLRCEAGPAKFPWLTAPFAFSGEPGVNFLMGAGVYGYSFAVLLLLSSTFISFGRPGFMFILFLGLLGLEARELSSAASGERKAGPTKHLKVAGIQLERKRTADVEIGLDRVAAKHPDADLLVMGEYAFDGPLPESVKEWCAKTRRWLIAGGREPGAGGSYYNTAYVVNSRGVVVFKQSKMVPMQLVKDGLRGQGLEPWDSPWGKIGICIGYDLGFSQVTDQLVRDGALALIVPTMDAALWGASQHELHARIGSLRAAEYGLPVFRMTTSGFSEVIDSHGQVLARSSVPGQGDIIVGTLDLRGPGRVPVDRQLVFAGMGVSAIVLLRVILMAFRDWWHNRSLPRSKNLK
jgi:apolipoprotein N-acyltransferase